MRVHAERHVVHEHVAVHRREVDRPLEAVAERVEGADDVVAVDTEVERQVVAGPGRDAHERQAVLARDPCDECLGTVATGHPQHVGAPSDRVTGERGEVVTRLEHDGFDPPLLGFAYEVERDDLPATRPWVHQEDGPLGLRHRESGWGQVTEHRVVDADRVATGRRRQRPDRSDRDHLEERGVAEQEHDGDDEAGHAEHRARDPGDAPPGQCDPRAGQPHERRRPCARCSCPGWSTSVSRINTTTAT